MKIAFRVDGSTTMGFGHIMRCLALVKQLKRFQKQVSNPKTEITAVKESATSLYSILAAPFLNKVNQPNLIILTDGLINYIPFESLI